MKGYRATWCHPTTLQLTNKPQPEPWLRFDSRREAVRYTVLRPRELAGEIRNLKRQDRLPLMVTAQWSAQARTGVQVHIIGHYVADFTYDERVPGEDGWRHVIEDAKGWKTDIYKWKKRHVAAQFGIEIREV